MPLGGIAQVGRLVATLGLNTSPFMAGAKGAMSTMRQLNASMMMIGRSMTRFVTLPMALAGGAAINTQKKFEASMTKIVGLVGVARDVVEEWGDSIKGLAVQTGRGPEELADAMFFVASAGIRGAEALEVLEMSAKAAAAGLGETKVVADLVTSAMNAYGKENLSAAQATDVLVAAVREGKAEADELAGAMGMTLPIASEYGVTFDQVGAAFAGMTRTGTNARVAATQLKAILSAMASPSMQSADAMSRFGISAEMFRKTIKEEGLIQALLDLREATRGNETAMAEIFPNIRALMGVLDLLGKNVDFNVEIFEALKNSSGSLKRAFEEVQGTTQQKLNVALAALKVLAIDLGEALSGPFVSAMGGIIEKLQMVTEWFSKFNEEQKKTILRIGGIVAAIGPLLLVLSRLSQIIATNPWFALAGAIALATTALLGWLAVSKNATKEEQATLNVRKRANELIEDQRAKVDSLYKIAKDETVSLKNRKEAIEELNRISPQYFGDLDTTAINTQAAADALSAYNDELLVTASITAAREELVKISKEMQRLQDPATLEAEKERGRLWKTSLSLLSKIGAATGALSDDVEVEQFAISKVNTLLKQQEELEARTYKILTDQLGVLEKIRKAREGKVDDDDDDDDGEDAVVNAGYLYELKKKIQTQEGVILGASKENLAAELDKLRALQEELAIAQLLSNEYGTLGEIDKDIQLLKMQTSKLSGQELINNQQLVYEKERQKNLILAMVGGLGDIEKLDLEIADLEYRIYNATGQTREELQKQLILLENRRRLMTETVDPLDEPLMDHAGTQGWFDYYERRKEAFADMLESQQISYMDYAKAIWDIDNTLRDQRMKNLQMILQGASQFISSMTSLFEAQKQAELKAVGDNVKAQERIEKKYLEKKKKWAIAQALINGALAVTNLIGNVPLSALNPATWVGIGLATVATAAQVAAISAQSFASGGIVYGETLARVGEYSGAANNPEVIAPLSDLKNILFSGMSAGSKEIILRVDGKDLVAVVRLEELLQNTY